MKTPRIAGRFCLRRLHIGQRYFFLLEDLAGLELLLSDFAAGAGVAGAGVEVAALESELAVVAGVDSAGLDSADLDFASGFPEPL